MNLGGRDGCFGQPLFLFLRLLHIPTLSLSICHEPLSCGGKMVKHGFHASVATRPSRLHEVTLPQRKLSNDAMSHSKILLRGFEFQIRQTVPLAVLRPKPPNPWIAIRLVHDVDACLACAWPSDHQVVVHSRWLRPTVILTSVNTVFITILTCTIACLSTCPSAIHPWFILWPLVLWPSLHVHPSSVLVCIDSYLTFSIVVDYLNTQHLHCTSQAKRHISHIAHAMISLMCT